MVNPADRGCLRGDGSCHDRISSLSQGMDSIFEDSNYVDLNTPPVGIDNCIMEVDIPPVWIDSYTVKKIFFPIGGIYIMSV